MQRIRNDENKENIIRIDCPSCGLISNITISNDKAANQSTVEIYTTKFFLWRKSDLDLNPKFNCPFCATFPLEKQISKDWSSFFECRKCKRIISIEYA
jgi:predicted RNA-binding Zn-ribbon protein involved in translation (DUF1610 family)